MWTLKGNVVGGYKIDVIGRELEKDEQYTFTDDQVERSMDIQRGLTHGLLLKVKQWVDKRVGAIPAKPVTPAGRQVAGGHKQHFAPVVPQQPTIVRTIRREEAPAPVVPPIPAPAPVQAAPQPTAEELAKKIVQEMIASGQLVPANQIDKKLDALLERPVTTLVTNVAPGTAGQSNAPADEAPVFIPGQIRGSDVKDTRVDVQTNASEDANLDQSAEALKAFKGVKTPLRNRR